MKLLGSITLLKNTWNLLPGHLRSYAEPLVWITLAAAVMSVLPTIGVTSLGYTIGKVITFVIACWSVIRIVDVSWTLYEGRAPSESLTRTLSWGSAGRLVDFMLAFLFFYAIVLVGFFLWVIPAFVLAFWFSFSIFAYLIEGTSPGTGALKRSSDLVSGKFWAIAWRWIMLIIPPAFMMMVIIALALIAANAASGDVMSVKIDSYWWNALIRNIGAAIFMAWVVVSGTVLFAEARKSQ